MSDLHVSTGDRTYIPGVDAFGDVTRSRLLGLKKGLIVKTDDGKLRAFCGNNISNVVDKTTGNDGAGKTISVPTDVKSIGPAILAKFGVSNTDQVTLFQKFIVLDSTTRNEKATFWEENQYDDDVLNTFIPEILGILESDETYISVQASKILKNVPDTIRSTMMIKMMQVTDSDARKGLIIRYTLIQNDRVAVENFMQDMFNLLLEDDDYIRVEMRRVLLRIKGMDHEQSDSKIEAYISSSTGEERKAFVDNWKSIRYFNVSAKKAAGRKVLHTLKKYDL